MWEIFESYRGSKLMLLISSAWSFFQYLWIFEPVMLDTLMMGCTQIKSHILLSVSQSESGQLMLKAKQE